MKKFLKWIAVFFKKPRSPRSSKEVAVEYFENNENAKDEVMKAYYAYHAPHFRETEDGHNFRGVLRESRCEWCGRSREMVRWDDLPPQCLSRPSVLPSIEDVVKEEELKCISLQKKSKSIIERVFAKMGDNEESRAYLWDTHGIPEEIID